MSVGYEIGKSFFKGALAIALIFNIVLALGIYIGYKQSGYQLQESNKIEEELEMCKLSYQQLYQNYKAEIHE